MVPNIVIDSNLWARMPLSEKAVYMAIARFAHPDSGLSYPSREKIRELTGCKLSIISKATATLVKYGLLTKKIAPKSFNFKVIYRVLREPRIMRLYTKPPARATCKTERDKKSGKFIGGYPARATDTKPPKGTIDTKPPARATKKTYKELKRLTLKAKTPSPNEKQKERTKSQKHTVDTGQEAFKKAIDDALDKIKKHSKEAKP